jgi:solute:Na+ symporter, SSS family
VHVALSVALVTAYVIVLTVVAVRARAAHEYAEFSLARRALPPALIFGSLCATYVGPAFSIGFVGKGFGSGFLFLGIGLAYAVQNILVGALVAPRLRALDGCHTLGDAIGQRYGSRTCQIIAGVISVALCAGFATVMVRAGGLVIHDVFHMPSWASLTLIAGVTALYTTSGGLRASVVTDAFQFTAFAILLPVILVMALAFHMEGGATAFVAQATMATREGVGSLTSVQLMGLLTAFLLGETLIPPYANRALASRTTSASRGSFVLGGLFSIVWFVVMVSLGVVSRGIVPQDTGEDHVLLTLVRTILPAGGYALLMVVSLSVIMSSLDSLLNAGAVAFTQDIARPLRRLSDREALAIGRLATVGIAAAAVIAAAGAMAVPSIISGLLLCYAVWAPAILPTLVFGLWLGRPRPLAGILSMATGALVAVAFQFIWAEASRTTAILPALGAALVAYLLGHLLGARSGRQG